MPYRLAYNYHLEDIAPMKVLCAYLSRTSFGLLLI